MEQLANDSNTSRIDENPGQDSSTTSTNQNSERYLKDILDSVQEIRDTLFDSGWSSSQSSYRNFSNDGNFSGFRRHFGKVYADFTSGSSGYGDHSRSYGRNSSQANFKGFFDEFESVILKGLVGDDIPNQIRGISDRFVEELGLQISDIPGAVGQQLGKTALEYVKKRNPKLDSSISKAQEYMGQKLNDISESFFRGASGKTGPEALMEGLDAAGPELINVAGDLAKFGPYALAAGAALAGVAVAAKLISKAFEDLIAGTKALLKGLSESANRYQASRQKSLELEQKRFVEDVNTLITQPFDILKEAAQSVEQAWDNALRTITATQGYNKADVQDLMAAYAERIRSEGLTDVVSGSSIIDNLTKVLESGLSGRIAEEFAYQATVLGAAIPTQDFFGYASTYSSIAANAIKDGKSQSDAIALANNSLKDFANNLLYASRELAGGYTTGLQNAQSLYEQSVKIAQAARTGDPSQISGVMTSVSAIVGAIAPDLANSITDAIYQAATGGNSSSIVALRSLAGINASNTDFLRALASDPQKVFTTLFKNLSNIYNQSSDAYMEKAEGYADLFGLSSEAFQRIDFNYLADAISNMNTQSSSLDENMELLASGQTTLTQEQLKTRQINQYMIEEGLTYVLDNAAARSIQEHMWDEQIARELMETEYGVNLRGAALEFLEGLYSTVNNLLNFLNPLSWMKKATNIVATAAESSALGEDIKKVLELGKVGNGNAQALYQLTTRGADLNLTDSLVSMMGGVSSYDQAHAFTTINNILANPFLATSDARRKYIGGLSSSLRTSVSNLFSGNTPTSKYSWGTVSKSTQSSLSGIMSAFAPYTALTNTAASVQTATQKAQSSVSAKIERMLKDDYLKKFIDPVNGVYKTYEDWAASAKNLGITDFDKAIEEAGYTKTQLQSYFQDKQTEAGLQEAETIRQHEQLFRQSGIDFWTVQFPTEFRDPFFEMMDLNNQYLETIIQRHDMWLNNWTAFRSGDDESWNNYYVLMSKHAEQLRKHVKNFTDYFINHIYYDNSGYNYAKVSKVQRQESSQRGDAVYALAEALTANTTELKDPTVQTNSILSQILIVVNAIMQQNNNKAGALSLSDTLSALSMGMTTST